MWSHRDAVRTKRPSGLLQSLMLLVFSVSLLNASMVAAAQQHEKDRLCAESDDACLVHFLDRVTWGASDRDFEKVKSMGLEKYLREQLREPVGPGLTGKVKVAASDFDLSGQRAVDSAREHYQENQRIAEIKDPNLRKEEDRANRRIANQAVDTTTQHFVIQSIYSDQQLRERMTWFWANHFSVDASKGSAGFLLPNYLAMIRSNALGKFRDLLNGVVKSPSMLVYLDNTRNRKGRINENLARELLELHTLGASGGYSQTDVTNVAHVLTGLGVTYDKAQPDLPSTLKPLYIQDGLFQFNPRFHDDATVEVLGQSIGSKGIDAIDELVDRLATHPSTAKFISRKLLIYFVQDEPTQPDIEQVARAFTQSSGDIASTLNALFDLPSFRSSLKTPRFKDPVSYVFSTVRRTQPLDANPMDSAELARHLAKLGSRPFRRATPDGYPLQSDKWTGSGQLLERVSIARRIAYSKSTHEQDSVASGGSAKCLSQHGKFDEIVLRTLGEATKHAVMKASDLKTCNFLLYSSPDFMMH